MEKEGVIFGIQRKFISESFYAVMQGFLMMQIKRRQLDLPLQNPT